MKCQQIGPTMCDVALIVSGDITNHCTKYGNMRSQKAHVSHFPHIRRGHMIRKYPTQLRLDLFPSLDRATVKADLIPSFFEQRSEISCLRLFQESNK